MFCIAGISDALDGFLAKNFGWTSRLGGILDPLADKLLLVALFLTMGQRGDIPVWLVLMVVARDALIVTGAIIYHCVVQTFEASPLLVSKLNTLAQLCLVFAILLGHAIVPLPGWWLDTLIYVTAATTVLSGFAYAWGWGLRVFHKGSRVRAE